MAARQPRHHLQLGPIGDDAVLADAGLVGGDAADGRSRRAAIADQSYLHPDVHENGTIAASRLHLQFDVWKYRSAARRTRTCGAVSA